MSTEVTGKESGEVFVVTLKFRTVWSGGDSVTGPFYAEFASEEDLREFLETNVETQKRYCSDIRIYRAEQIPYPTDLEEV